MNKAHEQLKLDDSSMNDRAASCKSITLPTQQHHITSNWRHAEPNSYCWPDCMSIHSSAIKQLNKQNSSTHLLVALWCGFMCN